MQKGNYFYNLVIELHHYTKMATLVIKCMLFLTTIYEDLQVRYDPSMEILIPKKLFLKVKLEGWTMMDLVCEKARNILENVGGEWYEDQEHPKRLKVPIFYTDKAIYRKLQYGRSRWDGWLFHINGWCQKVFQKKIH